MSAESPIRSRIEPILFRLLLATTALSLVGAGSLAVMNYQRLQRYRTSGQLFYQSLTRNEQLCADSVEARERLPRKRAPGEGVIERFLKESPCDPDALAELRQRTMSHIGPMNEASEAFNRYRRIAILVPLLGIALFFGGRWIFTGRVRPFWPTS
jgi:hypothetical protein